MSRLCFIGLCVENYVDVVSRHGNEIYKFIKLWVLP